MRDLTLRDRTQHALIPRLERTEAMLARAASLENSVSCDAEVVALSDLGVATNVDRMIGGFFTGALYRWEGTVPIVPVDATVNVCSVSIHEIRSAPSSQTEFLSLIESARRRCEAETEFQWNLAEGNHFVSLGRISDCAAIPDGDYLVLHASASEYKRTPHGLYPGPDVWFDSQIRTLTENGNRLRYLVGKTAERFIATASRLLDYNQRRHEVLAGLIGEELGVRPVECLPHYGMPDSSSVAIGCHWLHRDSPRWFLLLTEPDAEIPIIQPHAGANEIVLGGDDHILTPHGLGVCSRSGLIQVGPDAVKLGTAQVGRDSGILDSGDTEWRSLRRDPGLLTRILDTAPGEVLGWFKPRFSYHRSVRIG